MKPTAFLFLIVLPAGTAVVNAVEFELICQLLRSIFVRPNQDTMDTIAVAASCAKRMSTMKTPPHHALVNNGCFRLAAHVDFKTAIFSRFLL
jgi:hypothetical protein